MPNKLSYRSTPCIFIGYCSNQKGFRCYDPSSRRVYISRNVIFDEVVFPARVQSPLMDFGSSVPSTGNSLPFLPSHPSHIFPSSSHSFSVSPPHTIPIFPTDHDFSIPPDINSHVSSSPSNILEPSSSAPTSSTPSYHVVTRSQTGHLRPRAHTLIFISITQHVIPFELCMQVLLFPSLIPMLKLLLYLNGI